MATTNTLDAGIQTKLREAQRQGLLDPTEINRYAHHLMGKLEKIGWDPKPGVLAALIEKVEAVLNEL